jgi:hypothetical protein
VNVACMDPFNSILERGRKSIRISSLFFSTPLKRIFPDSGVPYPLVSTVGFAIFAICGRSRAAGGAPVCDSTVLRFGHHAFRYRALHVTIACGRVRLATEGGAKIAR